MKETSNVLFSQPHGHLSGKHMSENNIADFVKRIRAGDEQAAAELVQRYEPIVRREIRLRLTDPGLCRALDSMDICQSVMASFFVQAACGRYELDEPGQLIKLLVGMARNKLASAARRQRAKRRDSRRVVPTAIDEMDPPGGDATPSQIVAGKEMLREVQQRLSEEERDLAQRRAMGQPWEEIAAELGGTPNGRRVQLARALDRVSAQLGLDL
jgi:RNA polymerase sigma factor (sigma-70 family)